MNTKPSYAQKLSPLSSEVSTLFSGNRAELDGILYSLICRTSQLVSPQEEFDIEEPADMPFVDMGSSPVVLRTLELLAAIKQPHRVLEIGTFVGVSAMKLSRHLPAASKVITLEKYPQFAAIARRNIEKNGFQGRIEVVVGDVADAHAQYSAHAPYDLIFLDANKERYLEHAITLGESLAPGGLMVVDDVLFWGDVFNSFPTSEKGKGVAAFLKAMETDTRYTKLLLPIAHGVMIMRRN